MFFVRSSTFKKTSKENHSLQGQKRSFWQKAFLGALRRGAMTVEAAFILPLFLLGTGTLICFMDVMKIQTQRISHLCEKAMEEGMYAFLSEEKTPIIDIQETYEYRLPAAVVPLPPMRITNRGRVHSWTGMDKKAENLAEDMVYMAESGSVYHTNPQCSYLELSICQAAGAEMENRRNQYGARYAPCESCAKREEPAAVVYITDKGSRYHNSVSCSRLKRTVRLMPISETKGCPQCSRCQKSGQ